MSKPADHRKSKSSTELWQVGIVHAPIASLLDAAKLKHAPIHWLPPLRPFTFLADPFGIWHDGHFTILAEALDYRVKRGEIHYYRYDAEWKLVSQGLAMRAPYHLSYPFLIKQGDDIYMLPEAHRSGKLTLYRATDFPTGWEPVATLLNAPAIDASVIEYRGRWWMFYALPGPEARALKELHIAYADSLLGPWLPHTMNPVRTARNSARPGGTPFLHEGKLYLPTQDCTHSYGDAIHLLCIDTLTPDLFEAEIVTHLTPEGLHPDFKDGLHTLASVGTLTLIDVKKIDDTPGRFWINLQRRLRRLVGQA